MAKGSVSRVRLIAELGLAVLFAAAVGLPLLLVGHRAAPVGAQLPVTLRSEFQAPFPSLKAGLRALPGQCKAYLETNFAFRHDLIRWHANLAVRGLRVSTTPQVVLGRDGWLYSNQNGELADYRGLTPFTKAQLQAWKHELEARRDWLAQRGIHYLVVPVPTAYAIYPEHLPAGLGAISPANRADRFAACLRDSPVQVVDLAAALRAARPAGRLFHRTDSHWNALGAYFGYRAIVAALQQWYPDMQPSPLSDFRLVTHRMPGGALARELGDTGLYHEDDIRLAARRPRLARRVGGSRLHVQNTEVEITIEDTVVTERPHGDIPRVVVIRDSFCTALMPFLSEHFGRVTYLWTWQMAFPRKWIEQDRPQLVIQEFTTATLNYQQP